MKNATFYLLSHSNNVSGLSACEALACKIAAERWRSGRSVLIACEDEQQALRLDDALWNRDASVFVPHNLVGEGPRKGAPVELAWPQRQGRNYRDLLINLLLQFADFTTAFPEVIDFVPHEESLKPLARDRYKAYRSFGFQLTTTSQPTY
ncbi:MAG: DNA polymerase III subunit chi [Candidatus Malihini olakiniferum]